MKYKFYFYSVLKMYLIVLQNKYNKKHDRNFHSLHWSEKNIYVHRVYFPPPQKKKQSK
jgi:hypothetical protein